MLIRVKIRHKLFKLLSPVERKKSLPGVPFQWPNGQGTEKFFDGRNAARRWRSQYGSIYSIWSGFKREIVLTKPAHIKAFYKDSHVHIKSSDNNAGWLFAELLGECVGVVSQKRWKRVRGHFDSHFTRPVSINRTGQFVSDAREFLQPWNNSKGTFHIDPANDLKYCPFFMVAGIFFGRLTPDQRKTLSSLGPPREELFRETFMGGINRFRITKYFPRSAISRLRAFQKAWEDFVRDAAERASSHDNGAIVSLWEAVQNNKLSMRELLQTLDESMFANLDVTTHAVAWNILRLSQHTDIQQKVYLEMQPYVTDLKSYEEYLRNDDSLLAACVLEASRLHPILPFSNPESAEDNKMIDGYIIPRKTDVIVDAYAINVENSYWENAQEYDPWRHLGQKDQARRHNMWRFGFGPRQCLGKHVADIIIRVILAELLTNYELALVQGEGTDFVKLQADSWIGLPNSKVQLAPRAK
ncbi:cytochrome P450 [Westerdykella ornata]|uniref:Cytochrome P450 n=1 Tax=Westerdykella ornata TaxID=318751 RepID=A0A6A6JXA5_WESOR|nr:cytochrome P450 [Westerdykella ornata]KAF2280366.1 cytochrome P450 [Westerdykella ornata]